MFCYTITHLVTKATVFPRFLHKLLFFIKSFHHFFQELHDAIDGLGTDDSTLIRIIVSRCEIDLGTIKSEYERIYDRTLLSAVKVQINHNLLLVCKKIKQFFFFGILCDCSPLFSVHY